MLYDDRDKMFGDGSSKPSSLAEYDVDDGSVVQTFDDPSKFNWGEYAQLAEQHDVPIGSVRVSVVALKTFVDDVFVKHGTTPITLTVSDGNLVVAESDKLSVMAPLEWGE